MGVILGRRLKCHAVTLITVVLTLVCNITDFAKLVEEFRGFGVKLLQSASGRSHGSFEWVDSMLVQALKSGDWLLMDNVNFCK